MDKILIFGNSGSGKSTLAKHLCTQYQLAHLDLDNIAWLPTVPPKRQTIEASKNEIEHFTNTNESWVIEGCYADLLKLATERANHVIFMNLSVDDCIENAKQRPWEPHKYPSKQAQDENLAMLIDWINKYTSRQDSFSYAAHQRLYDSFSGSKQMHTSNHKQ